jgi:subtilisin-like proprotein convertase family protein
MLRKYAFRLTAVPILTLLIVAAYSPTATALPPAPPNDEVATAIDLGSSFPLLVYGTSVLGNNSINNSGGALGIDAVMDGPDVFYKLTPTATATYRFHIAPWQRAPLRSSEHRFTIYVFEDLGGGSFNFIAGVQAPGSARPVHLDVPLTMGVEYFFAVDHDFNSSGRDNYAFTLAVDQLNLTNPDDCLSVIALPSALPALVVNNIDGAAADFNFTQSGGNCAVSGTSPTTADGIDHVYSFTPAASGKYSFELISQSFDGVLYIDDSCDPFFVDGCFGASNHSTGGASGGKHELVTADLASGTEYFVFVDNGAVANTTGEYFLIVDDAFNYEINENEPNDSPGTATALDTPLNGGSLNGPVDEDFWAVTGLTGDRVYAYTNNGGSSNSTLDMDLRLLAADGSTTIEFDDEDGDGHSAPINDWHFVYSTTSAVIAGARLTSDGTHYWQVTDQSATGTVHRYRFHTGIQPASRNPLGECEPNDTLAAADRTGKNYYSGDFPTSDDVDVYAFEATVGDRIFVAFDGDPERNGTGSDAPSADPNTVAGLLQILDPAGDLLINDISDSNSIQSAPDYPAQGAFLFARTTGTHYVSARPQSATSAGPAKTYELAIFINEERGGAATEDVDPVISLTPDFVNDVINGSATDNAGGDSGVCAIDLIDNDNLQITNVSGLGTGSATFDIELVNLALTGTAKLVVTDCAGNTSCEVVAIDVNAPVCLGANSSTRTPVSMHDILSVPDNTPGGIEGSIMIAESGIITDVNVTVTIETISAGDIDLFLLSPLGTSIELMTDRGSTLAYDFLDTTFDDSATEIVPILSSGAPYTGSWLPEDPAGMAEVNGEDAQGTWRLLVIDDSSSNSGGARLVRWSLDIAATFPGPEAFNGSATDGNGIQSVVLTSGTNVQLTVDPGFLPGDTSVDYVVSLIDPSLNGTALVTVTDQQTNTCQSVISLNGLPDVTDPVNSGSVSTERTYAQEIQVDLPLIDANGFLTTLNVADSLLVGEVEATVVVDSKDVGRIYSTLTHGGEFSALLNRTGSDERGEPGLTKDTIWITLDDDAPQADDAHDEPALGSMPFLGLHQPDGRGEVIADGILRDDRDNMLFRLAGQNAMGDWDMVVGDFRSSGFSYSTRAVFRRWSMTLKNPCGPEGFAGTAKDVAPGTGIQSLSITGTNLAVSASFTPGDEVVNYRVDLVDPSMSGSGTLHIEDGAGNITDVPISLAAESGDSNLPVVSGSVNLGTAEFEGSASDVQAGDTGVASVELGPWSDNLQLVSVTPTPPAGSVDFVVGLVNPAENGRGYVKVTDGCGLRGYVLVEIDAQGPICSGTYGNVKRYFSGPVDTMLPDNSAGGVTSDIVVTDLGTITDVDVTFNVTHHSDSDIDLSLTNPVLIDLFTDLGSTGNDFLDTTIDDEAASTIPTSSTLAPFTGSWLPENGSLTALDGQSALNTYTLRPADDAVNNFGSFDNWSLRIEAAGFEQAFDGRAEDLGTHDAGICSVELLPGAYNLNLTVDSAFVSGAKVARYLVETVNPADPAAGILRVTDCAGNFCDETVTFGSVLEAWSSCADHAAAGILCVGPNAADIPGPVTPVIEPRDGNGRFELDMSEPTTAATASADCGSGPIAPTTVIDGDPLVVSWAYLALDGCCTITLGGDAAGVFDVVVLRGDADGNGNVNTADITAIKPLLGTVPNAGNAFIDIDNNGNINTADITYIKPRIGNAAPSCP